MEPLHGHLRSTPEEPMAFIVSCFRYEATARDAVRKLKYHRSTELASWMADHVARALRDVGLPGDLVVPVPIHWRRRAWRGFNQAELLALGAHGLEVAPRSLLRIRATQPQVGLSLSQRLANLEGAFRAIEGVAGRSILLVDDVITSGQTARVCARALLAAGACQVGVVTFAGHTSPVEPFDALVDA